MIPKYTTPKSGARSSYGARAKRQSGSAGRCHQAGSLAGCTGVVFGASPACEQAADPAASLSLMEVLQDLLAPLQVPVVYGWPAGHTAHQWTLPLGVAASLVAAAGAATLSFSAGAVA